MIPRVKIDESKIIHGFARASTHPYYFKNLPILKDLFLRSLKERATPSLDLQVDLLECLLLIDSGRRRYRRYQELLGRALHTLARTDAKRDRIICAQILMESMEDGEIAGHALEQRLRSIGDGLAWRILNYDRASLRLLAEHAPVSTPQVNIGLRTELVELLRLTYEEGLVALLNAVTNFLRVGDITAIDPTTNTVTLREVKSGAKTTARTRRQGDYLAVVQEGLDSGIHPMGGEKLRRRITTRPLKTYVLSVERAMREANETLAASRLFGDYLAVAVLPIEILVSVPEDQWPDTWRRHVGRLKGVQRKSSDILLGPETNVFALSTFSPNLAPYTVFPIDPDLRFSLMTGEFIVISMLNVSGLARWLAKRGWKAEVLVPGEIRREAAFLHVPVLSVSSGRISVQLGLVNLIIAATEFWMPESIEETIKAIAVDPGTVSIDDRYSHFVFPNDGRYAWD